MYNLKNCEFLEQGSCVAVKTKVKGLNSVNYNVKSINEKYLFYLNDPLGGIRDKCNFDEYIKSINNLSILEIGPGGGKILEHATKISKSYNKLDRYTVLDLDPFILKQIKSNTYLSSYPNLDCIHGDALNIPCRDQSFDIINLSGVAHECSTYQGGFLAFKNLVKECSRVLKPEGIIVFRELEGVNLYDLDECYLMELPAIAFFQLFLRKFISNSFCTFIKPTFYNLDIFSIFINNKAYTVSEYIKKFQFLNNYQKPIKIKAQSGFIREIQRHFITFINAYIPEYLFDITEGINQRNIFIKYEKEASSLEFIAFCAKYNITFIELSKNYFQLNKEDYFIFVEYLNSKFEKLMQPHHVYIPNEHCLEFSEILKQENIVYSNISNVFALSLGSILYLDNKLMSFNSIYEVDENVLSWSRREGDEYYFFGSSDEIINAFIKESVASTVRTVSGVNTVSTVNAVSAVNAVSTNYTSNHGVIHKTHTGLVPIKSVFVPRKKYISILKKQFKENNHYSEKEGKRIVHFQKKSLK